MQEYFIFIGIVATGLFAVWVIFRVIETVVFFKEFQRKVTEALDRIEAHQKSKP